MFEEVEDAIPKLAIIGNEIMKAKSETSELSDVIQELKEEAMFSKMVIRKLQLSLKMCFLWLCLTTIVIVYLMVGKTNDKKLALGY